MNNVEDIELLKKDPFKYNWEDYYIACVGENGGISNIDILSGFKDTAFLIIENIKNDQGIEDELIYPLVYSIRHCVELALKISLNSIKTICDIKNDKFDIDIKVMHSHDIEILSDSIIHLYEIDKRLPDLFDLALEYAKDYYFDKESDIFRYESSIDGKELLKELNIDQISIGILEKKFSRLYNLLNNAIYSLEDIKIEYRVGTWTKKLSRKEIEKISKELLPLNKWNEVEFDENRNNLKEKYGIGSNELSKAINLIKSNPLFISNIQGYLQCGEITDDELRIYAKLIKFNSDKNTFDFKERKAGEGIDELLDLLSQKNREIKEITKYLSDKAIVSILAFGDMFETGDMYCENYSIHFDYFNNNSRLKREWMINRIGVYMFAIKTLKIMALCGQAKYISVLKPLIVEIAEENDYQLEEWLKET